MISFLKAAFTTPDFWILCAFIILLVVALPPAIRLIKKLGKENADKIQSQIDNAQTLRQKAEDLLEEYENHLKTKDEEVHHILDQANVELEEIRLQENKKLAERLVFKERVFDEKLAIMRKTAEQTLTQELLHLIVQKTYDQIANEVEKQNTPEELEHALSKVVDVLEENKKQLNV